MVQPVLYLMLGYPGSGKTTTAKIIHEQTGAVHLWADHIRREVYEKPTYSHQENLELYEHLNHMVAELLAAGNSVVFDTNFNFYKDRQHLRDIAATHHAKAYVVWIDAPLATARGRATSNAHTQTTRVLGNMPLEDFERMTGNLEPPRPDETTIKLDGTNITPDTVRAALQAN